LSSLKIAASADIEVGITSGWYESYARRRPCSAVDNAQLAYVAIDTLVSAGEAAPIDEILPDAQVVAAFAEVHLD